MKKIFRLLTLVLLLLPLLVSAQISSRVFNSDKCTETTIDSRYNLVRTLTDTGYLAFVAHGDGYWSKGAQRFSPQNSISHCYKLANSYHIHTKMVNTKDSGDPPLKSADISSVNGYTNYSNAFPFIGWKGSYSQNNLRTTFDFPPKDLDTVTYIISVKDCDSLNTTPDRVEVIYDDHLKFIDVLTVPYSSFVHDAVNKTIVLRINKVDPAQTIHNLFLRFQVNSLLDGNPEKLKIITTSNCGKEIPVQDETVYPILDRRAPYDPNRITVDYHCLSDNIKCEVDSLEYNVAFQNIGDGPADSITVDIEFSSFISPNSFVLIDWDKTFAIAPNIFNVTTFPINGGHGQRVIFNLKDRLKYNQLRGTQEINMLFDDPRTIGDFTFKVALNSQEVCAASNELISNFADIYFNDLEPIRTNLANTTISCDSVDWVLENKEPQIGKPLENDQQSEKECNSKCCWICWGIIIFLLLIIFFLLFNRRKK